MKTPKAEREWCVWSPIEGFLYWTLDATKAGAIDRYNDPEAEGEMFTKDKRLNGYRCIRVTITPDTGDEG